MRYTHEDIPRQLAGQQTVIIYEDLQFCKDFLVFPPYLWFHARQDSITLLALRNVP